MGSYMAAESELQAPAASDQPTGKVDQLLHDGFYPSAFCFMPDDPLGVYQGYLPHEAKYVAHQCAAGHNQLVCSELARRQSLKIHVGIDLGVVLLRGGMPLVQVNDFLIGYLQAGPPAFKFILGYKELLTLLVDGAFSDAYNTAEGNCAPNAVSIGKLFLLLDAHGADSLAEPWSDNMAFCKDLSCPGDHVLLAGIPFNDPVNLVMS